MEKVKYKKKHARERSWKGNAWERERRGVQLQVWPFEVRCGTFAELLKMMYSMRQ